MDAKACGERVDAKACVGAVSFRYAAPLPLGARVRDNITTLSGALQRATHGHLQRELVVHVVAHVVALAQDALVEHVVLRLDDLLEPRVVLLEVDHGAARQLHAADNLVRRLRKGVGRRDKARGSGSGSDGGRDR